MIEFVYALARVLSMSIQTHKGMGGEIKVHRIHVDIATLEMVKKAACGRERPSKPFLCQKREGRDAQGERSPV